MKISPFQIALTFIAACIGAAMLFWFTRAGIEFFSVGILKFFLIELIVAAILGLFTTSRTQRIIIAIGFAAPILVGIIYWLVTGALVGELNIGILLFATPINILPATLAFVVAFAGGSIGGFIRRSVQ